MDPMQPQRALLYSLLGDLPDRDRSVSGRLVESRGMDGYRLDTLELDLNGYEPVPAYLALPEDRPGPYPVILYSHYHGGKYAVGKQELIDPAHAPLSRPYARDLTGAGYAVLAIDHWNFGHRSGRDEGDLFKLLLWRGQVLWGLMVYDSLKAIDYLVTRPDIDSGRIAATGMSMGSTMSWWTAALDTRIKVCAHLCCTTDFEALIRHEGLRGHGIYYFVPSLLKYFSTAEILALICPRPHLSLNGLYDALTPADGLAVIDEALRDAYARAGVPDAWRMVNEPHGHVETPNFRSEMLIFLKQWL